MTVWSELLSVTAEVIFVPGCHFVAATWALPDSLEKLRWSDSKVPMPAKFQDFYKDGWALARRLMSRWEADRHAEAIEKQQKLLNTLGWFVYALGVLVAVIGLLLGNQSFGQFEITGPDVENIGRAIIVSPFAVTVLVVARARYLAQRLAV